MNINNFLHKENLNTLWDVISDEHIFKTLNRDAQNQLLNIFSTNIKGFFENEKTKTTKLVEINKKYIVLILNYIKTNFSQVVHNKIKIYDEDAHVKELITYEEIQHDRKSQIEKDFVKLQDEFTNSMALNVPEVPEFADNYKDKPITEMDKIIKEMTAKRNYEIEEINRGYQEYNSLNNTSNWLKSQETSIKTEKFIPPKVEEKTLKYLNIEQTDLEPQIVSPKKNVTWGEDIDVYSKLAGKDDLEENIFKKLKKVDTSTTEDRITKLESGLDILNKRMDLIVDLLTKQNKQNLST